MPLPSGKTAKELGFKVGDKFKVVDGSGHYSEGNVVELIEDDNSDYPYFRNDCGVERYARFSYLEPLTKTLYNLQIGDELVNLYGGVRTVLGVITPGLYVLSMWGEPDRYADICTAKEIELLDWTFKRATPETPREVTMAEVVEKFGQNVVIRKED